MSVFSGDLSSVFYLLGFTMVCVSVRLGLYSRTRSNITVRDGNAK